jgi:DNA transposition AAA+ family ATPase
MADIETFDCIGDVYERPVDDIVARLEADARTHAIRSDIMDVRSMEALKNARELVNNAIHDGLVSAATLSRRTGIKQSAISEFRNDAWKGKVGTLFSTASILAKAVDRIIQQKQADETRVDGFVKTSVAREVYGVASYVVKRRMIGVFVIPAGSGKTMALEQLRDEFPGSILVTVTKTRSTVKSFLQVVARALGLDECGRGEDIQDAIVGRLAGSDRLLMVDEAHKLQVGCLDVLREIWDEVKVPMLLGATPSFYKTMTSRRVGVLSSELMDQFYSRVGMYRDLSALAASDKGGGAVLFTREDIHKVYAELQGRRRVRRRAHSERPRQKSRSLHRL